MNKIFTLEVTVEQFMENCSITELYEVELLINSRRYQSKMRDAAGKASPKPYLLRDKGHQQ